MKVKVKFFQLDSLALGKLPKTCKIGKSHERRPAKIDSTQRGKIQQERI
jgi:hypothetical protein